MKMTTNKNELLKGLNKLSKVIAKSKTIPVLEYVKISATENNVILTGTKHDGHFQLIANVTINPVQIEENGTLLLKFSDLLTFIKKTKSDFITIEKQGEKVFVSNGKVTFKSILLDHNEYPLNPVLNTIDYTLTNEEFKTLVNNTVYAVSKTETRPVLMAVNIKVNSEQLTAVATDAHRLGMYKLNNTSNIEQLEINVNGKGLEIALKLVEKTNKEINVQFSDKFTVLQFDNMELFISNIEGNYPETSRLIPDSFTTSFNMDSSELLEVLPQLNTLSKLERNNVINLNFENEKVSLNAKSQEVGEIVANLENAKNFNGENLNISFSALFLEESLKAMNEESFSINFTGKMRPFIIESKNKNVMHLILPVRTF